MNIRVSKNVEDCIIQFADYTADPIRAKYDGWLQRAIDKLEITIDNISYIALLDEDTNKPINNDLINEINDIIYKIEKLKEKPIMEPYPFKNR